ncbi:MAG: hypothetical protein K2O55_05840, partial [Alistipes sp.]|nr:hypothetical protein [Alistipes sp.]
FCSSLSCHSEERRSLDEESVNISFRVSRSNEESISAVSRARLGRSRRAKLLFRHPDVLALPFGQFSSF